MNDLVADSLTRIKNGYLSRKGEVALSYSKLVLAICQLLVREGFLDSAKADGGKVVVTLKYINRKPSLTEVKRVSKPGLRIYMGTKKLPRVLNGLGIAVISTPKGVMTDKQARKEGVGGEVVAYVW